MTEPRDVIADLLRAAGRRPDPPTADRDAVLRAASDAWRQAIRRRQRHQIVWGLAASVLCVAVILRIVGGGPAQPDLSAQFGAVESVQGEIAVRDTENAAWRPLRSGETLGAGAHIRASQAGAALIVPGTGSIRLRPATLLAVQGRARLRLETGTVYVDTDASAPGPGVAIETSFGVARDIGTVFELTADPQGLRLRVRDGRVELGQPGGATVLDAAAGEELRLGNDGSIRRGSIDVTGADWRWAEQLANPFNPEGRRLAEFLRWVARETGRKLRFRSVRDETLANNAVLHGTTHNLAPMEALDLMLAATDFEYSLTPDSVLTVGRRVTEN